MIWYVSAFFNPLKSVKINTLYIHYRLQKCDYPLCTWGSRNYNQKLIS